MRNAAPSRPAPDPTPADPAARPAARPTARDVARLAGVSQSAVSRVFTPGASASKATADKVRAAAAKLGYRPNVLARSLITGKSRIIGLVVAYLENQFYPVAIERLSQALQARGYHVLLFMASNAPGEIDRVVADMLAYRVDGILTASVAITNDMTRRCADAGIPVVLFNRGQPGAGLSSVTSANREGGRKVAEFLLAGGHRRIAHISGWQGASTGRDRAQGLIEGLAAGGAAPIAVIDGMYDRATAAAAALALIDRPDPPDAIFVGNDHMAFAVLDALQERGVPVPGAVSVVGYDDVPMAAWRAYDLTTVRQPLNRMVEATVETLLGHIEEPDRPAQTLEIDGPLIVRGSARLPEGVVR
jgi:DNA-binding LacI/PurR family transcriptional regulator